MIEPFTPIGRVEAFWEHDDVGLVLCGFKDLFAGEEEVAGFVFAGEELDAGDFDGEREGGFGGGGHGGGEQRPGGQG